MSTDQKNKFRKLVFEELKRTFSDYTHWNEAAARVLKQHPEFANCSAEFANEMAVLPSPTQFAQEVAVATQANGGNRDLAFRPVCEKYPGMRSPELSNQISDEDAAEQRDRREKLQKLMQKRAKDFNLNLSDPAIYTRTFNLVLQDHPELANAMHQPGRAPVNM